MLVALKKRPPFAEMRDSGEQDAADRKADLEKRRPAFGCTTDCPDSWQPGCLCVQKNHRVFLRAKREWVDSSVAPQPSAGLCETNREFELSAIREYPTKSLKETKQGEIHSKRHMNAFAKRRK